MGSFVNGSFFAMDEDQPRDEDGKFAAGSGGNGTHSGKTTYKDLSGALAHADDYGHMKQIVNEHTSKMSKAEVHDLAQSFGMPPKASRSKEDLKEQIALRWLHDRRMEYKANNIGTGPSYNDLKKK